MLQRLVQLPQAGRPGRDHRSPPSPQRSTVRLTSVHCILIPQAHEYRPEARRRRLRLGRACELAPSDGSSSRPRAFTIRSRARRRLVQVDVPIRPRERRRSTYGAELVVLSILLTSVYASATAQRSEVVDIYVSMAAPSLKNHRQSVM